MQEIVTQGPCRWCSSGVQVYLSSGVEASAASMLPPPSRPFPCGAPEEAVPWGGHSGGGGGSEEGTQGKKHAPRANGTCETEK